MKKSLSRRLGALLLCLGATTAGALPTTPGNLLVSNHDNNTISEYTRAGQLVQQFALPRSDPNWAELRDLVQGLDGRIHVFNGTFTPWMTTLNPVTGSTSQLSTPGWSTVNNVSYGGIARLGSHVFVSDMFTYSGGEQAGIVRFDLDSGSATRFAQGYDFDDLTLGLDGLLYGGSKVYDPNTLAWVRDVHLQVAWGTDIRGRAVDQDGTIYTADWDGWISRFNADGSFVKRIHSGAYNLTDIDINAAGDLLVGSRFGQVIQANRSLEAVNSFSVQGDWGPAVFVAFTSAVPEPGALAMMLGGLGLLGMRLRCARPALRARD